MSTRLVILGLLQDRPLYGYEIKSIIEDHMGDWTNIAFGSIYFALRKLSEEGFIEKVGTEQTGNRPSRNTYKVTESGRSEFMRLLREVWQGFDQQFFPLDIGLFFMSALPFEEVLVYLRTRAAKLAAVVQHLDEHQEIEVSKEEVPPLANAIFDHSRLHIQAEQAWTKDLLDKVERGFYP
jgi:DNA-binding PadR family transcriptional regulator